jgi:dihydropteroate synthase
MSLGAFELPAGPVVMGILDLSPGNLHEDRTHSIFENALIRAEQLLQDGAALIDIGCSAPRDGTNTMSVQHELDILIPAVEVISKRISIPISIETSNPEVMRAAVAAGAKMINDTRALTKLGAMATAAELKVHVCLMHMQCDPLTLQVTANYKDVITEVFQYLEQRIAACVAAGIDPKRIIIDPGFGFGKTLPQNLNLLRSLLVFKNLHCPILVDLAHKSMIGQILNASDAARDYGGVAAEVIAICNGAEIIRSHNVRATVDAIKVIKEYVSGS